MADKEHITQEEPIRKDLRDNFIPDRDRLIEIRTPGTRTLAEQRRDSKDMASILLRLLRRVNQLERA